jgi:hypothetical protein
MNKFELKTLSLDLVSIPPTYSLWDLSKKVGKTFGAAIFQYYSNADPMVFDKKETKKRFYDTSKLYYYYKLEKILTLSRTWYQKQEWQGAILIEKSIKDPRGKQKYVVHDGAHRFSVLRSYNVEHYEFLLINDRRSVSIDDLEEIKKFYKEGFEDSIRIYPNEKDGVPMIQPKSTEQLTERSHPMVEQWIESKLDFWEFVKS